MFNVPLLRLHLLVLVFASTGVFGHLISLSSPALVAWRTFLAVIGGVFLVAVVWKRDLRPPAGSLFPLIGIGVIDFEPVYGILAAALTASSISGSSSARAPS